jgi:serine-type D-Ala-D-Ala carboxypeptidase/endopeptidase (penicillin-binding protein 4)
LSRLHRLAWLSLALLSLFTMVAGAAVAHMLPARLALWRLPAVASRSLAQAGPVLGPADDPPAGTSQSSHYGQTGFSGPAATAAGVTAVLSGVLGSPQLGSHVGAVVVDLATGRVLLSRQGGSGFAPASTAKLGVAVAALHVLGPLARLTTRVVAGAGPSSIVLVGGGDPTLAAGSPPASDYPQPATLAALAARTARALRAKHVLAVRLGYDASLFTGPVMAPGWSPDYVSTGNVSPIEALEVDQGRLTASGAPQDADVSDFLPRSTTPAASAAQAFASFLRRHGIAVRGVVSPAAAPRGRATIASVSSPPLAEIVGQMLSESNNVIAENLARQVAIATGRPASFSGAAAAETAVLRQLGVRGGISLVDGSGLSPRDRVTPDTLVQLIRLAAQPGQPGLRPVITGMPVAGFSGTLAPGGSVFNDLGPPALGVVRAKTGNLATVASLAGIAYARNGQLLAFAFMADRLPKAGLGPAADDLTRLATSLAGCGCH